MEKVHAIDFNLVKYLEALLRNRSVTNAAKEVGITQPAMSNALSKLRDQFKDQLLAKTKNGYILTSKSQEILPQLEKILEMFEVTFLQQVEFNPSKDKKIFNGLISDSAGYILAPKILAEFNRLFPNIEINFYSMANMADIDKYDFAISSNLTNQHPTNLHCRLLQKEPFSVAGCPDHFKDKTSLKIEDYIKGTHYIIEQEGIPNDFIDQELEKLKMQRHKRVSIPHFSIGIRSLLYTPNIVTLPISILQESAKFIPLKIYQVPFELPYLHHNLIWHERVHNDPANQWFRKRVQEFFETPLL